MNNTRTGGVTDEKCAEDIVAEEPQRKKGRKKNAEGQRIIADRCAKVQKKCSEYPLHHAACDGECNEVLDHFIVNLKIHIDAKAQNDWTPLHVAAFKGHISHHSGAPLEQGG